MATWEFFYWDGTAWQTLLSTIEPDYNALGLQVLRFVPPEDWVLSPQPESLSPPPLNKYWIRVEFANIPLSAVPMAIVTVHMHTFLLDTPSLELLDVIYYPPELTQTEITPALDLTLPDWRTQLGTPRMYHQAENTALEVRIVPAPVNQGFASGNFPIGSPPSFINDNLVALVTVVPTEDDLPSWLEGLAVLRVAAREALRLGETASLELAGDLLEVARGIEGMLREVMEAEFLGM